MKAFLICMLAVAACGDNRKGPISYSDPLGGKLRLIQSPTDPPIATAIVLDLVVGDQPLTGYSVGFDLPLDDRQVRLASFSPGSALDPGPAPLAAAAKLPSAGPLAHQLVTAQSQKASGVATDTALPAHAVLYSIELDVVGGANGVVFDGTAPDFVLASGGMRDRAGTTVVDAKDVAIGKLVITP
jgi:hypothetical protein